MSDTDGLRLVIGRCPDNDFKVLLDGVDVTEKLHVKRVMLDLESGEMTTVALELYAENVDILADHARITVVEDDTPIIVYEDPAP